MKKLLFFLLALNPFLILAQTGQNQQEPFDIIFSPPRYYLGDQVSVQFKLNISDKTPLSTPVYEINDRIKVERIIIDQKSNEAIVTIDFRPYSLGSGYLDLDFGHIKIKPVNYYVSSLVEEGQREMRSAYGPRLLSGTRLLMVAIIMIILTTPPLLYFLINGIREAVRQILDYARSPYRRFSKSISRLYREQSIGDKEFYFILLENFRDFLSQSSGMKEYRSATAKQLSELLRLCYSKEDTGRIIDLYNRGDLVKFGGSTANKGQRVQDIDLISSLAKNFYNHGAKK